MAIRYPVIRTLRHYRQIRHLPRAFLDTYIIHAFPLFLLSLWLSFTLSYLSVHSHLFLLFALSCREISFTLRLNATLIFSPFILTSYSDYVFPFHCFENSFRTATTTTLSNLLFPPSLFFFNDSKNASYLIHLRLYLLPIFLSLPFPSFYSHRS